MPPCFPAIVPGAYWGLEFIVVLGEADGGREEAPVSMK